MKAIMMLVLNCLLVSTTLAAPGLPVVCTDGRTPMPLVWIAGQPLPTNHPEVREVWGLTQYGATPSRNLMVIAKQTGEQSYQVIVEGLYSGEARTTVNVICE